MEIKTFTVEVTFDGDFDAAREIIVNALAPLMDGANSVIMYIDVDTDFDVDYGDEEEY